MLGMLSDLELIDFMKGIFMSKDVPTKKPISQILLFWVGVFFTLAAPILVSIFIPGSGITWVVALCGAFVTLLVKLDDLVELSLGPVRAKMRETVMEANATVKQLRNFATVIGEVSLTDLMAGNFFDGTTLKTRLDLHDSIIKSLQDIGVEENVLRDTDQNWRKGVGVIYHRAIYKRIQQQTTHRKDNSDLSSAQLEIPNNFQKLLDFEVWQAPTPKVIKEFINSHALMTEELSDWINDYQHFLDTGEIPRRDLFVQE